MEKFPSAGCKCPACETLRFQGIPDQTYVEWLMNCELIEEPASKIPQKGPTAFIDSIPDYWKYQPTKKAMANDVLPSGVYRINYSIVDNYGFASTHSVVLKTQAGETPMEALSDFMNASEGYVRYDLIEYFLVRWENGEYVRV